LLLLLQTVIFWGFGPNLDPAGELPPPRAAQIAYIFPPPTPLSPMLYVSVLGVLDTRWSLLQIVVKFSRQKATMWAQINTR